MKLHKEGYKILISEIIIFSIINYLLFISKFENIFVIIIITTSIFFLLTTYFFRIPKRKYERKEDSIYSPCDGKIVIIKEVEETEYYKDKRIQISIFMSPLNVHNQIYPINGVVQYTKYHPGKYLVAWHPKSSLLNERSSIVVKNEKISILVRQIAGAVAKRIITYCKKGDKAISSNEYGFIKFGSRVDIFLPINTKPLVKLNQKVKSGITILSKF
tara:strand:+ start:14820 stop:15467 length:648 start_codon:yes stop_codon:yes gene_type:complete